MNFVFDLAFFFFFVTKERNREVENDNIIIPKEKLQVVKVL